MSNSLNVATSNGGGSGGSIVIFTKVFSGSHTGAIQSLGGSGNSGSGGGSGGRLAVHYSNIHTDHPYRGSLDVYGGKGIGGAESGASGTAYLKHQATGHSILKVNNNNQKSLSDRIPNEGVKLELSGGNFDGSKRYTSPSGVTVTTSCALRGCVGSHCHHCGRYYSLSYLFQQRYTAGVCESFQSNCASTNLVFDLKQLKFVNHIRVYPLCSTRTDFKVSHSRNRICIEMREFYYSLSLSVLSL